MVSGSGRQNVLGFGGRGVVRISAQAGVHYLSPMIFGTLSQQHGDTASAGFHREIYGDVESSIPGSAVEARFYPPVRFTLSFPAYPPAHFHPVLLSEADVS